MEYTLVGKLGKSHGLKGEIKVRFNEDFLSSIDSIIENSKPIYIEHGGYKFPFNAEHLRSEDQIIKFSQLNLIDEIKLYIHCKLFIDRNDVIDAVEPEDHSQHIGYTVIDVNSALVLGKIISIEEYPGHLMAVILSPKNKELLIPFVDAYSPIFDHEQQKVTMDLPEGIID